MDGWPVWLASLSKRDRHGRIVPTERWDPFWMGAAQNSIDALLQGVGDRRRERSFCMCITLCRHRALTDEEADRLPADWWTTPAQDLAGGPLQVLWSVGIDETPSTQPCTAPTRIPLSQPGLYLPEDCGRCEPCQARATCRARLPVRPRASA
jgi:hypothetical protein